MSFVAVAIGGSAVLGAASSIYSANQNKKAIQSAIDNQKTVDIGKLVADSRVNAEENLKASLQLERENLPGQAAAREAATQNFLSQFSPNAAAQRQTAMEQLLGFTQGGQQPAFKGSELFSSAADRILADLNLGGELPADVQNAVARGALQGAGGSGVLGSEAGRGLVARDLGLTSLQLQQARQNAALNAGNTQTQLYLQALGLGVDATTGQLNQAGNLYGMMQGVPLPESGLSSSDIANVTVGQTNSYNQNLMNAAGVRAANNSAIAGGITGALQQGLGLYAGMKAGGVSTPTGSTAAGGAVVPSGYDSTTGVWNNATLPTYRVG